MRHLGPAPGAANSAGRRAGLPASIDESPTWSMPADPRRPARWACPEYWPFGAPRCAPPPRPLSPPRDRAQQLLVAAPRPEAYSRLAPRVRALWFQRRQSFSHPCNTTHMTRRAKNARGAFSQGEDRAVATPLTSSRDGNSRSLVQPGRVGDDEEAEGQKPGCCPPPPVWTQRCSLRVSPQWAARHFHSHKDD